MKAPAHENGRCLTAPLHPARAASHYGFRPRDEARVPTRAGSTTGGLRMKQVQVRGAQPRAHSTFWHRDHYEHFHATVTCTGVALTVKLLTIQQAGDRV